MKQVKGVASGCDMSHTVTHSRFPLEDTVVGAAIVALPGEAEAFRQGKIQLHSLEACLPVHHVRQDRIFNAKQTLVPKIRCLAELGSHSLWWVKAHSFEVVLSQENTTRSWKACSWLRRLRSSILPVK